MNLNEAITRLSEYANDDGAVVFRGSLAMADFLREVHAAIWELPEWNSDKYMHHCVCMCERCYLLRQGIAKLRTLAGKLDA